jgi:hypothetical protein
MIDDCGACCLAGLALPGTRAEAEMTVGSGAPREFRLGGAVLVGLLVAAFTIVGVVGPRDAVGRATAEPGPPALNRFACPQTGTYTCASTPAVNCLTSGCSYCSSGCPTATFAKFSCVISETGPLTGCVIVRSSCGAIFLETLQPCNLVCACDLWSSYSTPCVGVWQSGCTEPAVNE